MIFCWWREVFRPGSYFKQYWKYRETSVKISSVGLQVWGLSIQYKYPILLSKDCLFADINLPAIDDSYISISILRWFLWQCPGRRASLRWRPSQCYAGLSPGWTGTRSRSRSLPMFSSCSSDRSLTEETEETPLDRRRSRSGPRADLAGRRLRSRHSDSRGPAPPHTAPSGCAPPPAWGCTSPGIPVPPHRYPLRSRSRHRSLRTEVSVREMLIKEERNSPLGRTGDRHHTGQSGAGLTCSSDWGPGGPDTEGCSNISSGWPGCGWTLADSPGSAGGWVETS